MATNQYPHATRYVSDQVWTLREAKLDAIVEVLRMRAAGIEMSKDEIQARIGTASAPSSQTRGSVAVLPCYGVIDQKVSMMVAISGGTALTSFMESFRQYRDDASVTAIVIDFDTPGGSVYGVEEASNEIYKSRGSKPIIGLVNPECGSAGLWLAASCSELVCTPSGMVGSLGAFMCHIDESGANEAAGIKPTYIAYGEFKVEGNSDQPISDEARLYRQMQVDTVGEKFVAAVARGRNVSVATVKSDFGSGRMLLAKDALKVGMIDRIDTYENVVAKLVRSTARSMAAEGLEPAIEANGASVDIEAANERLAKTVAGIDWAGPALNTIIDETHEHVGEMPEAMAAVVASQREAEADRDAADVVLAMLGYL